MFGKPPGGKLGFTAGRSPIFRSVEQLNGRVGELMPATPRAGVGVSRGAISGLSKTRPWRINIAADSHGTASSGDSLFRTGT